MNIARHVLTLNACIFLASAISVERAVSTNVSTANASSHLLVLEQLQAVQLLKPALQAAADATETTLDSISARHHLHASRQVPSSHVAIVPEHPGGPGQMVVIEDAQPLNATEEPSGSDIWNPNVTWSSITRWHPSGLISNVHGGAVMWTNVSYMSLNILLVMSMVCYPAFLIMIILVLTILVSICLVQKPRVDRGLRDRIVDEAQGGSEDPSANLPPVPLPPVMTVNELSPISQKLYYIWGWFCCLIPSFFVFGMPALLVALSSPFPQEVFSILTFVTALLMCSNGMYMVVFSVGSVLRMRMSMKVDYGKMLAREPESDAPTRLQSAYTLESRQVRHWVVLPQYKEELEIVAMALESISKSGIAKEQIGIVLAMEEREAEAAAKAAELTSRFGDKFVEIISTYHPPNLPNDPPGKASNLSWAFNELVKHLASKPDYEVSNVILTVSDADSEFHHGYYEGLTHLYMEANALKKKVTIWQSPVFHLKNYHRQPMPVIVGTMFTCMQELAALSDPNAIRFPYSTYSLSLDLARRVGGWDAEWIAEDWHMGIKCFLLTLGESSVEPLLLPTANYTPEDTTYFSTVNARWSQAKRHALGFSDMAYFFQMIPLIFCHAVSDTGPNMINMHKFWGMLMYGMALVIKLTNVHVIIGVITTYSALGLGLKFLMEVMLTPERHVDILVDQTHFCATMVWVPSLICTIIVTFMFQGTYELMKGRIEGKPYKYRSAHWATTAAAVACFAPFYFVALGIAIWKAAVGMIFQRTFEYEVAKKPTAANRLVD